MADNARGVHVSPGVYTREVELNYAVKSLGITTLGLVGETQRGPAFEPVTIENWRQFQDVFGGTSTEKFAGSQYPKYEAPYIAKSYLSESNQLQVCRVLGLSGYNAGPAWVVKAAGTDGEEGNNMAILVLRSRGYYEKYHKYDTTTGSCECPSQSYDTLFFEVGEIADSYSCDKPKKYNMSALALDTYIPIDSYGNECTSYGITGESSVSGDVFPVSSIDYGHFKIKGITGAHESGTTPSTEEDGYFEYAVSLNPNDKDYILKVLGTDPYNGDAPIYVEALYDVALEQMIQEGKITGITQELVEYNVSYKSDYCALPNVADFITKQEESLSRRDLGKRYIAAAAAVANEIHCHPYDYATKKPQVSGGEPTMETVVVGQCYTVRQYTDAKGKRHYYYAYYPSVEGESGYTKYVVEDKVIDTSNLESDYGKIPTLVMVESVGRYFRLVETSGDTRSTSDLFPITCDMNDYREPYRFSSTPWIVSNVKGDLNRIELNRLFRFHTISDGNNSSKEIKISLANIKYDEKCFDVIVRDINDTDASVMPLETFKRVNLIPGDANYIGFRIGSFDGIYESKSKYITVEVNENIVTENSIPAGFMGYPLSQFDGLPIDGNAQDCVAPVIKYNLNYNEDVKHKRQYFGLSNISGVDVDMFTYKGVAAYGEEPGYLSQGFHLDSRLNDNSYASGTTLPTVTVDGIEGYKFDAVSTENRTEILDKTPVIGTESEMENTIYENVDLRKFTVYFYGGFDGWDVYRTSRTNTDDYKVTKYRGDINETNGLGMTFDKINNYADYDLTSVGITSDFYAYLSAARKFANPEGIDINVFATPGIDLINNTLLAEEIIDMLEEERADSIYVATLPDKPFGASDYVNEMYKPEEIVKELDDTEINSNYTCVYYPWVKYEDTDNNQYIYLPPTKDVVRNMAITDNTTYPWFAPAGVSRGDVACVRAHYVTKLADEDTLYEGRINPVKTFASDGVKLWGQKNLQVEETQLNRIAVRRLLLRMRKLVAIACIGLIFEPNDATTKNKFLSTVTPILDNIKANRGISDYKIEVNDTAESRERRELPAKIFFKPLNALEYITLDFVLTPEGVDFDAI